MPLEPYPFYMASLKVGFESHSRQGCLRIKMIIMLVTKSYTLGVPLFFSLKTTKNRVPSF